MRTTITRSLLVSAFCFASVAGCGDSDLTPELQLFDQSTQALSFGNILEVNGKYGSSCVTHANNAPWSIASGGFTATNPVLRVVTGNAACTLSVTSVRFEDAGNQSLFAPPSALAMSGSYPGSGTALRRLPEDPVALYFNAKLSDATYSGPFSINLVYSDDPLLTTNQKSSGYRLESSSATSGSVLPPDYSLSFSSFSIEVDVDDVVLAVGGTAGLTDVMQTGEEYVITSTNLGASPSFAALDDDYAAGTKYTISGANPTIDASRFNLVGEDLTSGVKRNLIIKHSENGTTAYERFLVTFDKP
jgi:hypothetical protein